MPARKELVFLLVLLGVLTPVVLWVVWPFFSSFLLAGILAISVYPLKRRVGALSATLITVLVLGGLAMFAGIVLTREVGHVYDTLSAKSEEAGGWPEMATHALDRVLDGIASRVAIDREAVRAEILARMRALAGLAVGWSGALVGSVTTIIVTAFVVAIFLYFLLRYGEAWLDRLDELIPLDRAQRRRLLGAVHGSIVGNMYGLVAAALGQGLLLTLGFWIIGLKAPFLWGMVGAVASVVPVLGTPLVWVPVLIGLLFQGAWGKAIFLGLWGGLAVGSVDNVLRPMVAATGVNQHPVIVAIAAIGGVVAFGPIGVFLGPLLFALFGAVVAELERDPYGDADSRR